MRSKEFDVDHDQGNQHTESSIEGSIENSILVEKPQLAIKHRKKITWQGSNKKINASYHTYDLDLNMHLIKDRSDTTVGKRSRKQKFSAYESRTQDHPRRLHTRF